MARNRKQHLLSQWLPDWANSASNRPTRPLYHPTQKPTQPRADALPVYSVFVYDGDHLEERASVDIERCQALAGRSETVWINVDGLRKQDVEALCAHYNVHYLAVEDILSAGQRAKMDDFDQVLFCLLPMLFYNGNTGRVETEQVSIVFGDRFLISFQEDPKRDVFNPVREKLRAGLKKMRTSGADYLCYALLDVIVDSYYTIILKINERVERLEDSLLAQQTRGALEKITILRREILLLQRSISPVRELVSGMLRSENNLIAANQTKYFKDVLDHITQAVDYVDNYREQLLDLHDLHMSQLNMRMNAVMKTFTMVATLLAPATVIGGIFGMNFDIIPMAHQKMGFYLAVTAMILIPLLMLFWFKRRGWF